MSKTFLFALALAAAGSLYVMLTWQAPDYAAPSAADVALLEAPPSELIEPPGPQEQIRVFRVEGMCCRGCSGKLYRALSSVAGVHEACVDFERGTASARVATDVPEEALRAALTFEKYSASSLPATR